MKNKWTYEDPQTGAYCVAEECNVIPGGEKTIVEFEIAVDSWQEGRALANRLVDTYKGINRVQVAP